MGLQIAIYDIVAGRMVADWTHLAQETEVTTNEHGYGGLQTFIALPSTAAFYWYDRPGLPWIEVYAEGVQVWRGRWEDVTLTARGIKITALGAWSVLSDVPYTFTPSAMETADVIVGDILAAAVADNPTLLSDSTTRIEDPGITLYDELYEDEDMRKILVRLAGLGDSQTPPQRWEVGFWEAGRLYFRPRGTDAAAWYVDASDLEIQRSLSAVWNSVYARYDSGASTTATADDTQSITRYGVTRRKVVTSRTTDLTAAERERDAVLADNATPIPRASVPVKRIYTAAGGVVPLWRVRSGDTITLRNLPPEAGNDIDRIRTFRIAETRYRCDDDTLEITPESPIPSIDVLLARALEVPETA